MRRGTVLIFLESRGGEASEDSPMDDVEHPAVPPTSQGPRDEKLSDVGRLIFKHKVRSPANLNFTDSHLQFSSITNKIKFKKKKKKNNNKKNNKK